MSRPDRRALYVFCYKELKEITRDFSKGGVMRFSWSQLRPYGLTALEEFPVMGREITRYIQRRSPRADGQVVLAFDNATGSSEAIVNIVYFRQADINSGKVRLGPPTAVPTSIVRGDPRLN